MRIMKVLPFLQKRKLSMEPPIWYTISPAMSLSLLGYQQCPFSAPTNLQLSQENIHSIHLTWTHSGNDCDGFKIDRKVGDSVWQTAYGSTDVDKRNYTDTSATPAAAHTYRIYTYADANQSAAVSGSITLTFPAPSNLQVEQISLEGLNLTWDDNSAGENGFYISEREITHRQYKEFLNERGVFREGSYSGNELIDMDDPDCTFDYRAASFYFVGSAYAEHRECPVIEVSWYGTREYCNWKSQQEGLTACYIISSSAVSCDFNANGYRLPIETDWEYATRSGGRDDRKWSGTNNASNVGNYAWCNGNCDGETHPLGTKQPKDFGIYDMTGNVWEWCWDWYRGSYYSSSPSSNPGGPSSGRYCVVRGGSWRNTSDFCRTAVRNSYDPARSHDFVGFRILRVR